MSLTVIGAHVVLAALLAFIARRHIVATAVNRRAAGGAALMLAAIVLNRFVSARAGIPIAMSFLYDAIIFALGGALLGLAIDLRLLAVAALPAVSAVVGAFAFFPGVPTDLAARRALAMESVGILIGFGAAAWIWYRPPEAAPPPGAAPPAPGGARADR
jgi:hypothetical protein